MNESIVGEIYRMMEEGTFRNIEKSENLIGAGSGQSSSSYVPAQVVTLFGGSSPSSTSTVFAQMIGVIIGLISRDYINLLLTYVDGLEILVLMSLALIIWKLISDPIREWLRYTKHVEGIGFRDELVDIIDYGSYIVVFVVIGYFGRVITDYVNNIGISLTELNLLGIIGVIYIYDFYASAKEEIEAKSS